MPILPAGTLKRTWGGFAVRASGQFVFAGKTSYSGAVWNLGNTDNRCTFVSRVSTFGLGLGGEVELNLIFFFNLGIIANAEGMDIGTGGSIGFSLPVTKLGTLGKTLQGTYKLYKSMSEYTDLLATAADAYKAVSTGKPYIYIAPVGSSVGVYAGATYGVGGSVDLLNYETAFGSTTL